MAEVAVNQLYINTEELTEKFNPSLTNYFSVYIPNSTFGGVTNDEINIFAYEAVLPGTSLEFGQIFGDRQGITESYPIRRTYPPIDVSFYVNKDYKLITYFENWIESIFTTERSDNSYGRFNYPKNNWKVDMVITKFERDFRRKGERLLKGGTIRVGDKVTYNLKNAFPVNVISAPVSYSQTDILRTTITFNYDFYTYEPTVNKQNT
jgi:hypothetical protein